MSSESTVNIGKYKAECTDTFESSSDFPKLFEPKIEVVSHFCENDVEGAEDCGDEQDTLTFRLRGVSIPMANTLRRLIMTEVPVMAFDSVVIEENDGVVFDESLSHRIGLVPIHCSSEKFEFVKDIALYDSPNASPGHFLKFTLSIQATDDLTSVYSGDLKWEPLPGQEELYSLDVKPVNQKILLCKLAKGGKLKLTAYAVKGLGLSHAKWCPVSCSTYRLSPKVEVNTRGQKLSNSDVKAIVRSCPVGVFDIESSGDLVVKNESACTGCRECIRAVDDGCECPVTISRKKDDLIFTVESIGQMSSRRIVSTALEIFSKHCMYLKELVERSALP